MKVKLFEFLTKGKKRRAKESMSSSNRSIDELTDELPTLLTSSASWTFGSSSGGVRFYGSINENFSDYVFGEKDMLPTDVALKRIEKYKKQHPEEFTEPLEKMYKKAYPKEEKKEMKKSLNI